MMHGVPGVKYLPMLSTQASWLAMLHVDSVELAGSRGEGKSDER